MHRLYYQHEGTWFGDCMPHVRDGRFYLFHQRDTRRPGPFGEPFGWALARTSDFVDYEDFGEVVHRGADDEQDQFVFAGSVFEADGRGYAIYTGYNRDYGEQGRAAQVLMLATSDDLIHWTKTGQRLVPPEAGYDPDNWRDPFVLWDDETQQYVMILGSRLSGSRILTGRTVWFTSPDLQSWTFQGDFWAPGLYNMHEMPDLFRIGDFWYLLTTEYSDKSKTVYRMSRSLSGPWSAPVDDAFDGRAYYAARSASDGEHRYLFGWVATKEGDDDLGAWQWGGTLVVHEVFQRPDGSLGVRVPPTVRARFGDERRLAPPDAPVELRADDGLAEALLGKADHDPFRLELRVRFAPGTRSFAIRLFEDDTTGDGYAFTFLTQENRLLFDRRPNYPWYRYDNRGLERPITLAADREYTIEVVVDDTIATLYVDGVALNVRAYERPGSSIGVQVVDGGLDVLGATLTTMS